MAIKRSVSLRNATLDAAETHIGASPTLRIYEGTVPASTADAPGTLLAQMTLPADWMGAASSGSKAKLGTWEDTSADASGTAAYYRIYDSASTPVCHEQGTVTATGGGGDLELDNTSIASGQKVEITGYTWTAGNA